jgi:phenylacetate-CoA ligase
MRSSSSEPSLLERARWSASLVAHAPLEARFPFRSPAAIARAQRGRLRATVRHASEHVPYYRETMRRLDLGPGDFETADDLAKLPVIERAHVQRDPEYFVSRAQPLERHIKVQSGGSTGEPLAFYRDHEAIFLARARRERYRSLMIRLAGRRLHCRMAAILIGGGAGGDANAAFRRLTLIPPRIRVTSRLLSVLDPPERNVSLLNEFRPDVIATYGSYLEMLFAHLQRTGQEFHPPRVITYAADALSPAVRRLITEQYGIEVLSVYQAIETPMVAFECERHTGLHVNIDVCPVRIAGADGSDAPVGESGDVIVSNLANRGTVLLNYRVGDVARLVSGACPCGRNLPLMSLPEGRIDDWITTASGRLLHPLAIRVLVRQDEEVLRYQVVQEEADEFTVTLVARPGADREGVRRRVNERFRELLGPQTRVTVGFADSLPRTPAGKVLPVITSRVGQRSPLSGPAG